MSSSNRAASRSCVSSFSLASLAVMLGVCRDHSKLTTHALVVDGARPDLDEPRRRSAGHGDALLNVAPMPCHEHGESPELEPVRSPAGHVLGHASRHTGG